MVNTLITIEKREYQCEFFKKAVEYSCLMSLFKSRMRKNKLADRMIGGKKNERSEKRK